MTVTGVVLFIVPPGRIANWTGWTFWALTKHQWTGLHDWFSIIFVVASLIHLYLNWKPFVSYFKNKITKAFTLRTEWALALVICVIALAGTIADVTPFSDLLEWNENIKQGYDRAQQQGPIPHAELLTLTALAEQVPGVELETMLSNLKEKGIEAESADTTLGELAEANNTTPARLYEIAVGEVHSGGQRGGTGGPSGGAGGGFGRMTLTQYCQQAGLDVNTAVESLKKAGFDARPESTIREIADSAGVHPSEIRAVIDPESQH